jgi:type IV pilus assembly protein PilA
MFRQTDRRRGFSLIEMLIVVSIILIIITVAVPKFLKAQMAAHELGAIKAIQTIHQAEVQYQSQFGRYANSLQEIGPPASGPATPSAADLVGNDLAGGEKSGYKFTLTGSNGGYVITAVPVTYGTSGSRTFYSDQTMVLHQNFSAEPATVSSPEYK